MIMENTRNGELGKLTENLSLVRAMNAEELGFPEDTVLPDNIRMESINKQLRKMQNHYSPLKKLQLLLRALALAVPHLPLLSSSELQRQQQQQSFVATQPSNSSVFLSPIAQTSNSIGAGCGRLRTNSGSSSSGAMAAALKHPPADELIRWLVYLLARSSTINCEIEAWYMWELLPQQVLSTGDASYFLSILFSAVHVIKHPEIVKRLKNISLMPGRHPLPNIADFLGSQSTLQDVDDFANNNSDLLLRVAIPNEQEGSIEYHTFPVLPKMNASKLCRVIAHQFSVSNPEDYGLYVLFDGYETVLSPDEFPHLVRDNMIQSGKGHLFAYKRSETRIAWPKQAFSNFGTSTTIHTEKKILVEPPKNVNIHHHHQQPQHQPQSSSSSSRLTSSSSGKGGRIKAVASSSNNRLANKNNNNNMLFNIGMHA
uniref:Ras-associating domain-containing protein n=1 Tax=Meloidogyne incognita TaxID=6306 RepID=A0A914LY43_MELIC